MTANWPDPIVVTLTTPLWSVTGRRFREVAVRHMTLTEFEAIDAVPRDGKSDDEVAIGLAAVMTGWPERRLRRLTDVDLEAVRQAVLLQIATFTAAVEALALEID